MCFLDINQLDVTPESDSVQQMPDLVLKTGDVRVENEPAVVPDISEDEDSWPSESSDEFNDEPMMTSSHPAPSKYSNREDVVCKGIMFLSVFVSVCVFVTQYLLKHSVFILLTKT